MLTVTSFSKYYREELILSVEALTLSRGIHLVKGDNGSGKTTFFKCLAGIVPCRGEISIDECSLKNDPLAYRYLVNFAEAEPVFPAFLTAKDLVLFVAKTKNSSVGQVAHYRQRLGIDWYFEKACSTYSSGMLKKLSLMLAFLGNPKVIILDEPLITLDEVTRSQLYILMQEKPEIIFLISSHHEIDTRFLEISTTYRIRNKTLVRE
jgi:ABC-2 type transport system ATP-binding protein